MSASSKFEDCSKEQRISDSKISTVERSPLHDVNGVQLDDWKKKDAFRTNGMDYVRDCRRLNGLKNCVSGLEKLPDANNVADSFYDGQVSLVDPNEIENQRCVRERNGFTEDCVMDNGHEEVGGAVIVDEGEMKPWNGKSTTGSLLPGSGIAHSLHDSADQGSKRGRVSEQFKKVSALRESLRTEEARLLVLRKLLDSQRGRLPQQKQSTTAKQAPAQPSLHAKPPIAQPTQQVSPKGSVAQNSAPNAPTHQPIHAGGSKPVLQAVPAQPVQKFYIQVGNQLVPAPPPAVTAASSSQLFPPAPYPSQSSYPTQQPVKPASTKQTPEQKQSAAKAALRRQLEQTLLQIPPPHPPTADWKAIPNVNSMDFMMLVGLDEVVDSILDIDDKPTLKRALSALLPYSPRICVQCKVDFSPCWKSSNKLANNAIVCERCSLQNVKKDLKAEHTSRLKSAFLKALKQEQEIEERIKAGEDVNIGSLGGCGEKLEPASAASSPVTNQQTANAGIQASTQAVIAPVPSHTVSPSEPRHHPSSSYHHRHQVVQHYPHHTSLVHQLHQQHIHQQQLELEPSSQRHSSRWHPYMAPSHHNSHGHSSGPHRPYASASGGSIGEGHPEYYVVHHPQHSSARWQRT